MGNANAGEVEIIRLSPDRWREYRDLRLRALRTDPIAFNSTYAETETRPETWWRQRLADPRTLLLFARVGAELAGTMGAVLGWDDDPQTAAIIGAFVAPPHRNRGLGKSLLRALLSEIATHPEITRVQLFVTETQAPAIALYASCGFTIAGASNRIITASGQNYRQLIMEHPLGDA